MKRASYTLSTLIDDLTAIYNEKGDIPVEDGRGHSLTDRQIEVVEEKDYDDDSTSYAVQIGRRF